MDYPSDPPPIDIPRPRYRHLHCGSETVHVGDDVSRQAWCEQCKRLFPAQRFAWSLSGRSLAARMRPEKAR